MLAESLVKVHVSGGLCILSKTDRTGQSIIGLIETHKTRRGQYKVGGAKVALGQSSPGP